MKENEPQSGFSQFLAEIRRRHVGRFALGYAAAAFVVLQLAEIIFPAFELGESGLRLLVIVVTLGFPPAVVVAWIFDVTADGIQRTEDRATASRMLPRLGLLTVTVAVVVGLGAWLKTKGVFEAPQTASAIAEPDSFNPDSPIRSLAVLPLDDFSPEPGHEYFTAGMHEELIAQLSQLDGLRVVSRTSVASYAGTTKPAPQIGRELGVDAYIEGSVRRSGDQVRITLQVIHAASGYHIRTLQFDRSLTDVLALQSEVAHEVAHAIGEHSGANEPQVRLATADIPIAAQEAYLMGKMEYDKGTPEGYRTSLDYFKDAVEEAPDFAPAVAGMAGARFLVSLENPVGAGDQIRQARAESLRAVQLDSSSVEAREVYGFIRRSLPRLAEMGAPMPVEGLPEPPSHRIRVVSIAGITDSISIDASAFDTAWVAAVTGLGQRIEESVRARTMQQRPGGTPANFGARQLMGTGRFEEAATLLKEVVNLSPEDAAAWEMLLRAEATQEDVGSIVAEALRWSGTVSAGAPSRESVAGLGTLVDDQGVQGYWRWTLNRLTALRNEGVDVPRIDFAAAHAALGDSTAAFSYLLQALERGERGLFTLQTDPVWDNLRADDRFRQLARSARSLRFGGGDGRPDPSGRRPPNAGR